MVITKTTVNTGSTQFETVEELIIFLGDFNVIKRLREIVSQQKASGVILNKVTVLTGPCTFEDIVFSPENLPMNLLPEIKNLFETLGWTSNTSISYEYT